MTFTFNELLAIVGVLSTLFGGGGAFFAWSKATIDRRDSMNKQMDMLNQRLSNEITRMDGELKQVTDEGIKRESLLRQELADVRGTSERRERELQTEIHRLQRTISHQATRIAELEGSKGNG